MIPESSSPEADEKVPGQNETDSGARCIFSGQLPSRVGAVGAIHVEEGGTPLDVKEEQLALSHVIHMQCERGELEAKPDARGAERGSGSLELEEPQKMLSGDRAKRTR